MSGDSPMVKVEEVAGPVTVTEADVLGWLRKRYSERHGNGERYVYATHVRSGAGFDARRTADAVAMDLWPSRGLELHGHEVKVSCSDWLTELKHPEKHAAVARFCDRWWLVVPDPRIVRPGELPDGWGLLVASPDRVRASVKAPARSPEAMTRSFAAALLRAAVKSNPGDEGATDPRRLSLSGG